MIKIYCDESGFTGSKLLDQAQSHFIYGAVKLDDNEAYSIVHAIKIYLEISKEQELKYKSLGQDKQKIMQDIIAHYKNKIFLNISYKPFVVASWLCQFITTMYADRYLPFPMIFSNYIYEYHYEIVQEFYTYFLEAQTRSPEDKKRHKEFLIQCIEKISIGIPNIKNIIKYITTDEMDILEDNKYYFDLSISSINTLITTYFPDTSQSIFYCDNSKPIKKFFSKEILGKDKYSIQYNNLKNKIRLEDSKKIEGLQVIDLIVSYIFNELKNKKMTTWTEISDYLRTLGVQFHIHAKTTFLENKDILLENLNTSRILHRKMDIDTENIKGDKILDKLRLINNDRETIEIINEYFGTI